MSNQSGKVTRAFKAAAKAAGNKYYFTGKTCRNGHISDRATSTGLCVICTRDRSIRNRPSRLKQERKRDGLPEPTRPEPPGCEICGNRSPRGEHLSVDHCHVTGEFRGWLCGNHNRGIGLLGDDLEGLRKAIKYLERFHAR